MKEDIKKRIVEAINGIPKGHLSDAVIKETIRCVLYEFLKGQGLHPIPAFRNPLFQKGLWISLGSKTTMKSASPFAAIPRLNWKTSRDSIAFPARKGL